MDNDSFAKKFLTKSVFVLALGIFVAGVGFGYRQVKDANYLNTDTTRTISVRGVSEMDVVSDRTIFDFTLAAKNVPGDKAAESFIKKEKDFYTKIPKNLISIIQKTGQSTYPTYGQIEPYAKTGYVVSGNYKIVLDNKSLDEIEATRSALLSAGVISEDLSYRYTLKNPEVTFKALNEAALKQARDNAGAIAKASGASLGKVVLSQVGTYSTDTQQYFGDTAYDLFYGLGLYQTTVTQNAYVTYLLR